MAQQINNSGPLSKEAIQKRNMAAGQLDQKVDDKKSHHAITVRKSTQELYTFWRNFENLSKFMKDVESIKVISPKRSHWVVKLKSGASAEWDADITADEPGKMISWSSVEGSEVKTRGTVWFENATGGRGGVVRLSMDYEVPGGKLTEFITMFMGEDPDTLMMINLRRLKALLETGVIPTVEGQPSGREENSTEVKVTH